MPLVEQLERYSAIAQVAWGFLLVRLMENKKRAAIGSLALVIILRHVLSKKRSKFISDFSRLAQETKAATGDSRYDFDEYDVIIVGGGTVPCVAFDASRVLKITSHRYLGLCLGLATFRRSISEGSAAGGRWQVCLGYCSICFYLV